MIDLQKKIEQLKDLLSFAGSALDSLTFESFDVAFPTALGAMKKVHRLKNDLVLEYGTAGEQIFREELLDKTKQIEHKFDNIVEAFTEEEKKLERELSALKTKKKLTVYKG